MIDPPDDVVLSQSDDEEIEEEWVRAPMDDVRGVVASKIRFQAAFPWQVTVRAMEFVFEEPLESEIRDAIVAALAAVPGADAAMEGDREVWVVGGTPHGRDLVRAVAAVVDAFADQLPGPEQ
jgi:hypothetical protein